MSIPRESDPCSGFCVRELLIRTKNCNDHSFSVELIVFYPE